MLLLSTEGALALSLALVLAASASASELASLSESFRPEPQETTRLMVEYTTEDAHHMIKQYIHEKRSEGLVGFSESNYINMPFPYGISILSVPNDPDTIDSEISILNAMHGIKLVEEDSEMLILSSKDQQKLRGGKGKGTVDHIRQINGALKTTADQLVLDAHPDQFQGRRLSEEVPYGITMVNAPFLFDKEPTGDTAPDPVKICVVDTGYDVTHEDLPELGYDHGFDGYGQMFYFDGHGHGTHCAGIIGAIGNNNQGVTSVNPDPSKFQFIIGKGISDSGVGTTSNVMEAVSFCVGKGAKVISMSFGGKSWSQASEDLFQEYYDQGGKHYTQ